MNAERQRQLNSFASYAAKLLHEGVRKNGGTMIRTKDFTEILLGHKQTLLTVYGEEVISGYSPHLLKQLTKGVQKVSVNMQLDFGDELTVPDFFTVTDDKGESYRLVATVSTFEDWQKHNELIRKKYEENLLKYRQLENARLYLLSVVGGNKKAKVCDAIERLVKKAA